MSSTESDSHSAEATGEAPPAAPPPAPSATIPHKAPLAYALALGVVLADQITKLWILYSFDLPSRGSVEVFGPFSLTMVWNQGVSFGLLRAESDWMRWLLSGFSLIVAGILAVWARQVNRNLLGWAIGLIMGGAIGNLIDRVRYGAVADFLDFKALHFPWVFNIADSAITIGVILLLADTVREEIRSRAGRA
ncbi:MAG: signal peptidase II [Caulobacter sp.]